MMQDVEELQKQCGKPVLVADIGNWCATAMNPQRASVLRGQREREEGRGLCEHAWVVDEAGVVRGVLLVWVC